jgi:hypothetical protein
VWSKIKGWIDKILSSGGKYVLIKSVAKAILVYSMSCFRLPKGLCFRINYLIRQFWWGSTQERKSSLVSWKVMTRLKFLRGLGFRDLELFNLALLAGQAWRIPQEPNSLDAWILKVVNFSSSSFLDAVLGSHPY